MAEAIVQEATPKKVAFMSKPKNVEERIQKDEKELEKLLEEQKEDAKEDTKAKTEIDDTTEPDSAEERSFKKRYGDLRKHQQQQQKTFEDKITNLERQLGEATKKEIKLPKTEEELETWAKEYPDVAAIVESIAIKKAREQSKGIEDKIKQYEDLRIEASKEKAEAELLSMHPDFSKIRESDEFHTWAEDQPKWVQNALYENDNDAKSAARAIDLYKADMNIASQKPSKDAAKAINTKGQRSEPQSSDSKSYIKESDVQAMSAEEYEKKADAVMEAIRSGKFIYDLSGSAR
jgi:chromosome segregation ATPase